MRIKGAELCMSRIGDKISMKLEIHSIDSIETVNLLSEGLWSVLGSVEPDINAPAELIKSLN